MTKVVDIGDVRVVVVQPEAAQQCDRCGKIAELRPYGPGGFCICIDCGYELEPATRARCCYRLFGDPLPEGIDP